MLGWLTAALAWRTDVPGRLVALLGVMVMLSGLFGAGLYVVQSHARHAATSLANGPGAADLAAAKARVALADADRVVATTYLSGGAEHLGGAGPRYQDDVKVASQALATVASATPVRHAGADQIQAAEAVIVPYMGLVDDAHADVDRGVLGIAQLAYASEVMHASEWTSTPSSSDGLLAQIRQLTDIDAARVAALRSTPSATAMALPTAAGVVLVAALIASQVYLFRAFRRVVNVGLVIATVLAFFLLAVLGMWAAGTRGDLHDGAAALDRVTGMSRAQEVLADAYGARARSLLITPAAAGGLGAAPGDTANHLRLDQKTADATMNRFTGLLDDVLRDGATTAEKADIDRARIASARFARIDFSVAQLVAAGRQQDARNATLQSGSDHLPDAFRQADDNLGAASALAERRAVTAMAAAAGNGLGSGLLVSANWSISIAVVAMTLLIGVGMLLRIYEYR